MTSETPPPLVPELRFPEFRDAPGWIARQLSDLYDFGPTNTLSRDKLNYSVGTVKNIHYGDIHTRFRTRFDITREVVPFVTPTAASDDFDRASFCTEGDIIFADASEDVTDVGKCIEIVVLDGQRLVSGTHTIFAKRKGDEPVLGFGSHLFRAEYVRAQIRREAQGTKVYAISPGRLANIDVCLPPASAEQKKIADCLTSLDDQIAAEDRRLAALRQHKQGLMQQLFPQPGETVPRLRFPEFHDANEWMTRKISSILVKKSQVATIDDNGRYREIGVRSHGKGLFHKEPTTGKAIGTKRVFHVIPGALVINIVFAWEQALAVTTPDEVGFIASHRFPMFVPKDNQCNVGFMQRLFLMPLGKELLKVASPGGAGRNRTLSQKEFENLDVLIPETAEQERIAACLGSLDALIAAALPKLDGLRAHKKGLMQQLFPAPKAQPR